MQPRKPNADRRHPGTTDDGADLDPFRAWTVMMTGEKPGGHGERCMAVGTLDMAVWDAAAKIAGLPLHRFVVGRLGRHATTRQVPVYAGGGYPYPDNDIAALSEEVRRFADLGVTHVKIKIGGGPLDFVTHARIAARYDPPIAAGEALFSAADDGVQICLFWLGYACRTGLGRSVIAGARVP